MATIGTHDQAHNLRRAITRPATETGDVLPAIAITGGKGGVGKTCLAVNLALMLTKLGRKALLVDCDLSLANADVLLGLNPSLTLFDVLCANRKLTDAIVHHESGLGFIPAASGRDELTRLSDAKLESLLKQLASKTNAYQPIIFDTPAGIGNEVMCMLRAAQTVVTVVTPDPTSLTDAYALIKLLEQSKPGHDIRVVINMAQHQDEAMQTYARLQKVVTTYLHRDIPLLGILPRDQRVADAVRQRKPFALGPEGQAVLALRTMAMRLK
jgi:flagellar biosynthesis protein FlhG